MDIIEQFDKVVDDIYGVYLDSTLGFRRLVEWVNINQKKTIEELKIKNPQIANIEYMDDQLFLYGRGHPNIPSSILLHHTTQKELKIRNCDNGNNFKFIGNLALVSLYQYWEDHYRSKIAEYFILTKNQIKSPIMGDICLLRNCIIHNQGISFNDVKKCSVLKWFKPGDKIFIDMDKFEFIIIKIKEYLNQLKNQ
jgi:hypothetical protein